MRLKPQQTGYVATKIGIDLANASFIALPKGREAVVAAAKKIIDENLAKEHALDEKVKKITYILNSPYYRRILRFGPHRCRGKLSAWL